MTNPISRQWANELASRILLGLTPTRPDLWRSHIVSVLTAPNALEASDEPSTAETTSPLSADELRLLFNKGVGVQKGNRFSYAFPTEEEANQAFHYIAELGTLETSQPPLKDSASLKPTHRHQWLPLGNRCGPMVEYECPCGAAMYDPAWPHPSSQKSSGGDQ